VLDTVPDDEPFMPPDSEQFAQMVAAMAMEQQGKSNQEVGAAGIKPTTARL
jgi:hypothetical protein